MLSLFSLTEIRRIFKAHAALLDSKAQSADEAVKAARAAIADENTDPESVLFAAEVIGKASADRSRYRVGALLIRLGLGFDEPAKPAEGTAD